MSDTPQIVRDESTGLCWQVDYWPDLSGDVNPVVLRRGAAEKMVVRASFFNFYTVIC